MTRYGRIDADDKLDRYYTPEWATLALLERLNVDGATIAEPCAGQGHIVEVLEDRGADVVAGDIDPDSPYCNGVDATDRDEVVDAYGECDAVITNPPYSADSGSASDVIDACLYGLQCPVWALNRLSFLEPASGRHNLLSRQNAAIILPRVHYSGPAIDGKSQNAGTSVWCGWQYEWVDTECQTRWVSKKKRDELQGQSTLL